MRILCITKPNKIMKNLLIVALIVSAFACTKKEAEVKVDPSAPKTGKFEYTFTAKPENRERIITISFDFYTIQGTGRAMTTSKKFVFTSTNNIAQWDTTLSANSVMGLVATRNMMMSGNIDAKFNGVTLWNQLIPNTGTSLITKYL